MVATCSYEARHCGVRPAVPISGTHRRCPDAVYLRPWMAHDRAVACEVRAVLDALTPVVEPISIDEALLDLTDLGCLGRASSNVLIGMVKPRFTQRTRVC